MVVYGWWIRNSGNKLKQEAILPDNLFIYFTMRTLKQWLPAEVVQSPSLEVSKT